MATPFNLVSPDAQLRLTEFSDAYAAALSLGTPNTWAKDFGLVYSSRAIRTLYPLPVSAAGYKLRQGDDKMRTLYEKSLSIKPREYQDGVQEKAQILEAPDFFGFTKTPSDIALETLRFPNKLVAQLLKDNPTLEFDSKALFASDHPINVLDDTVSVGGLGSTFTFDNDFSSGTVGTTAFSEARAYFENMPGMNGEPMGMSLSDVIVPPALAEKFRAFLSSDLMYNAQLIGGSGTNLLSNNIWKGAVNLVVAPELKDADIVYWVAKDGPKPWIVQDGGSPEQINYDKDSDLYKDTGYVGIKYVLTMGAAAAMPHAIARQTITG